MEPEQVAGLNRMVDELDYGTDATDMGPVARYVGTYGGEGADMLRSNVNGDQTHVGSGAGGVLLGEDGYDSLSAELGRLENNELPDHDARVAAMRGSWMCDGWG